MSNIKSLPALKPSEINEMATALDIITNTTVQQRFIGLFNLTHGNGRGEAVYHSECVHFIKQLNEKSLHDCDKLSIYTAFMDVAVRELSFDPSAKLCYLIPRNINIGSKAEPKWVKSLNVQISPYGELALRIQQGHISDADEPNIVYEGDEYTRRSDDDGVHVTHTPTGEPNRKILFAYLRYTLPNGTRKTFCLDLTAMERFKGASAKQNNGTANALYTSYSGQPDPGFFMAKCVKHAFKSMPKIKIGMNRVLESEVIPDEVTDEDVLGFTPETPTTSDEVPFTVMPSDNPESSDNPTVKVDF